MANNVFDTVPKDLMRFINLLAFDRDSLKKVFLDIKSIQSSIRRLVRQVDRNVGFEEMDEEQIKNLFYPSTTTILETINERKQQRTERRQLRDYYLPNFITE
jgi:hypothetical protein